MFRWHAGRKVAGIPLWGKRHRTLVNALACALTVGFSAGFVVWEEPPTPATDLLWMANGVLLAYLLLAPRRRWAMYLAAGLTGQWICASLVNHGWVVNLPEVLLNIAEVLVSALLLKARSRDLPDFTRLQYQLRFLGMAVLAGPAVAGLFFGLYSQLFLGGRLPSDWMRWIAADGLGTAVMTPACVALFRSGLKLPNPAHRAWIYWLLLVAGTVIAFQQSAWPPSALIYPLLVLMLLAMGMAWAALGALFVTIAGSHLTTSNRHLFGGVAAYADHPAVRLQILVVSAIFTLYCISIVLERQAAAERTLSEIAALHGLVTENSRDLIILAGMDGQRSYVSGAAQSVAGWLPEELVRYNSVELVHPDDRMRVGEALGRLKAGKEGELVEYRMLRREGTYFWVEASLRLIRDSMTGKPKGVLNLARDISRRKQAEQELREAYAAIEALAVTDPLTRLANRRRFDQYLSTEWRRALREVQPLSLLLVDVDHFKSYNDTYGHLRGDSCLKQIAEAALDVVTRPGDLVARFGGEEFAVILPNTNSDGAEEIAHQLCEEVKRRKLTHASSATGWVTVSVGCATMVPIQGQPAHQLVQRADEALYEAKGQGRDRVVAAGSQAPELIVQQAS